MRHPTAMLAAVALASSLGLGASHAATDPIQPGDYMETSAGSCTLNFVYDGTGTKAGKVYLGTAAHCVERVGQEVKLLSGEGFGTVALLGDADSTSDDWALIEVRTAYLPRVSAAMKGNAAYPKGVTATTDTTIGDLVQLSGYGLGYGTNSITQERRQAVFGSDTASYYTVTGPIHWGDSGGPLVHVKTGKALGIVSRLCFGACSEEGPTVANIISRATAKGFPITLRTV